MAEVKTLANLTRIDFNMPFFKKLIILVLAVICTACASIYYDEKGLDVASGISGASTTSSESGPWLETTKRQVNSCFYRVSATTPNLRFRGDILAKRSMAGDVVESLHVVTPTATPLELVHCIESFSGTPISETNQTIDKVDVDISFYDSTISKQDLGPIKNAAENAPPNENPKLPELQEKNGTAVIEPGEPTEIKENSNTILKGGF